MCGTCCLLLPAVASVACCCFCLRRAGLCRDSSPNPGSSQFQSATAIANPSASPDRSRQQFSEPSSSARPDGSQSWEVLVGGPNPMVDATSTRVGPHPAHHVWQLLASAARHAVLPDRRPAAFVPHDGAWSPRAVPVGARCHVGYRPARSPQSVQPPPLSALLAAARQFRAARPDGRTCSWRSFRRCDWPSWCCVARFHAASIDSTRRAAAAVHWASQLHAVRACGPVGQLSAAGHGWLAHFLTADATTIVSCHFAPNNNIC